MVRMFVICFLVAGGAALTLVVGAILLAWYDGVEYSKTIARLTRLAVFVLYCVAAIALWCALIWAWIEHINQATTPVPTTTTTHVLE